MGSTLMGNYGNASTHPAHYSRFTIEPVVFCLKNKLPFAEGNIVKYVCRHSHKNGLEDLLKARHYLDLLITHYKESSHDHA